MYFQRFSENRPSTRLPILIACVFLAMATADCFSQPVQGQTATSSAGWEPPTTPWNGPSRAMRFEDQSFQIARQSQDDSPLARPTYPPIVSPQTSHSRSLTTPSVPQSVPAASVFQPEEAAFDFGSGIGFAGGTSSSLLMAGGYIDNAQIRSRMRLRYDAGFDLNRPDRAEFFYASWANLADHPHAIKDTDQLVSSVNNRGPILIPESIDYQDISLYFELARSDRMSVFIEQPYRFVQFNGDIQDANAFETPEFRAAYAAADHENNGLADSQIGIKYAICSCPDQALTFQLRTYLPTGDSQDGLGTGHVSIEPGLLLSKRLSSDVSFMGQLKYWSPIDGGANAGNIAIYGAGLSRDFYTRRNLHFAPVAEFVGWTVLDGFETLASPTGDAVVPNTARIPIDSHVNTIDPNYIAANGTDRPVEDPPGSGGRNAPTSHGVQNSAGQTIINLKLGVRTYLNQNDDVYVGWGRSLTGARWYQDVFRIEFRRSF